MLLIEWLVLETEENSPFQLWFACLLVRHADLDELDARLIRRLLLEATTLERHNFEARLSTRKLAGADDTARLPLTLVRYLTPIIHSRRSPSSRSARHLHALGRLSEPSRPYYLQDLVDEDFDEDGTYSLFVRTTIGDKPYTGPDNYLVNMSVNELHEWNLEGSEQHPFHIHVNHVQFVSVDGPALVPGWNQVGDWVDTVSSESTCARIGDTRTAHMGQDRRRIQHLCITIMCVQV